VQRQLSSNRHQLTAPCSQRSLTAGRQEGRQASDYQQSGRQAGSEAYTADAGVDGLRRRGIEPLGCQ
jgi:hypothetical protein